MKRIVSNIQNLGFTIVNAPSEDKKVKAGGIILDQTLVNGQSQGVSVRLINGTKKTAAVKLDKQALPTSSKRSLRCWKQKNKTAS